MDLTIVIPVFNEVDNITPLVREVRDVLGNRLRYEVIVVDDASTDGTGAALQRLLTEIPELRVLRHAHNAGQSSALLTGVREARAAWVATLDGDGQNLPADIETLLAARDALNPPPALLAGVRQRREDNWLRRLSSRVANGVRCRLLRDDTPDSACGLKLFRRDVFLTIPHFNHMHRFLPALVKRAGGRVINVRVGHRPRRFGQSKYGLFDRLWAGIVDLLGVMWLRRRQCSVASEEWQR